ncbi:AMP-binding protein [Providencia rettgeri]
MALFDYINNFDNDKKLFKTPNKTETILSLKKERESLKSFLYKIRNKKIALNFNDYLNIAKWLFFLDGIVSRITILPYESVLDKQSDFIKKSETDFLITESDDNGKNVININLLGEYSNESFDFDQNIDTEWVITTSGTTGTPKLVKHTLSSLTATVKNSDSKENTNIWGLLYGLQRFAGIQVYLQSVISGNLLVIPQHLSLPDEINFFNQNNVTCLSATPTLWRKLLMLPEARLLPLRVITLGGEIADSNILKALSVQFPNAKIRHIYASTEAGVGFSVTDGQAGFPISYFEKMSLKISNENTLLIKSSSTYSGYIGSEKTEGNDGFIDTGDLVEIRNNRCYFLGRANGSINVGGNKVQPEQIERIILSFPGVLLVSVSAKKSSIMGSLVQASLVVDPSIEDTKSFIFNLKNYCKANLEDFMVPTFFKIVNDLKINATGKVLRNE